MRAAARSAFPARRTHKGFIMFGRCISRVLAARAVGCLLAASVIGEANGWYSPERLAPYEPRLRRRFGGGRVRPAVSKTILEILGARVLPVLLGNPWLTRHLVLDRGFLNAREPALGVS